jgi:hypothetical protein
MNYTFCVCESNELYNSMLFMTCFSVLFELFDFEHVREYNIFKNKIS